MGLSTTIAVFGIATDSTAVVIGAMLIAPLMTPILATASALLHGRPDRALRTAAIVVAVVGSIALAWIFDLAIAMAAGAAGAFATTRSDVSDTLPGVAVAIALVPPLAVVGLTLHARNLDQALGALLLFGTNLVSIVAMASIVFVLTGYVSWSRLRSEHRRVRASYATVAVGLVALMIPLGLTARNLMEEASSQRRSEEHVARWLGERTDLRVSDIAIDGTHVLVGLCGSGEPPAPERLRDVLAEDLGGDTVLEIRSIPEQLVVVGEADAAAEGNATVTD